MFNGSEKGFPPSKSSIASPRLSRSLSTGLVENDENDSSENQMIPKFENHKKMVAKNFMSPTISAAAKAVSPRKKILGERNENPVIPDSQNSGAKNIPQVSVIGQSDQASSLVVSSYNYATESDDNKGDADSLAKGYDPTNYLIPRPKYLRYNPSRRSEVLNRLVNDGISFNGVIDYQEGGDGELPSVDDDVGHSSFSSPNENSVRLEVGENAEKVGEIVRDGCNVGEEEEDEEEEEEEEVKGRRGGGWLRGVFKHMVMLIACFMFMSYISPMNSPAPLPAQQCLWNSTDGCLLVGEQALDFMTMKMHDSLGFLGVDVVGHDYGLAEEIKVYEASEDDKDNEQMAKANGEILEGDSEDKMGEGDGVENTEGLGAGEFEFEGGDSFEQMRVIEFDESVEDTDVSSKMEVEPEAVDAEIFSEIKSQLNGFGQLKGSESEDVAKRYTLESIEMDSDNVEFQTSEIPKEDANLQEEKFKPNLADEERTVTDSGNEYDETGYDYKTEMQKLRWSISAVVGVFLGALLLAVMAFFYRSVEARNKTKESKAAAVKKLKQKKAAGVERASTTTTTVLPPMERKVEFLARPSLPHQARESLSELNYRVNAPTVELIGEIVIGGRKSSTNNFQVNEYFKDSHATNPIVKQGSLTQPVSTPIQTSAFECLPSYATETKIFKKEGGQSGEAASQSTSPTPLRRSTRLRRAAAMSP